jgi:hypothetical protein
MIFFGDTGFIYIVKDPHPELQQWRVRPNLDTLEITFLGDKVPYVDIYKIDSWQHGAALYQDWVREQGWWRSAKRFPRNYMQSGTQNVWWAVENAFNIMNERIPNAGVWMTQYRTDPFGVGFPDHTPKDGFMDMWQRIEAQGAGVYPYLNGVSWDVNRDDYDPSRMLMLKNGDISEHSPAPHLKNMCSGLEANKQMLVDIRESFGTKGVYLDAIGQVPEVCYATNHDHEPGDTRQIIDNTNDLLSRMTGEVFSETFSEQTLGLSNAYLSLSRTGIGFRNDNIPLLPTIFGEIADYMGWQFGDTTSVEQMYEIYSKARGYALPYPTVNNAADLALHENELSVTELLHKVV